MAIEPWMVFREMAEWPEDEKSYILRSCTDSDLPISVIRDYCLGKKFMGRASYVPKGGIKGNFLGIALEVEDPLSIEVSRMNPHNLETAFMITGFRADRGIEIIRAIKGKLGTAFYKDLNSEGEAGLFSFKFDLVRGLLRGANQDPVKAREAFLDTGRQFLDFSDAAAREARESAKYRKRSPYN